jgi:hypothetical protein
VELYESTAVISDPGKIQFSVDFGTQPREHMAPIYEIWEIMLDPPNQTDKETRKANKCQRLRS